MLHNNVSYSTFAKPTFGNLAHQARYFRKQENLPIRTSELAHDIWHTIFSNDSSDIGEAKQSYAEFLIRQRIKLGYNLPAELSFARFSEDKTKTGHLRHVSKEELIALHPDYVNIIEKFEREHGKITIFDLENPKRLGRLNFKG